MFQFTQQHAQLPLVRVLAYDLIAVHRIMCVMNSVRAVFRPTKHIESALRWAQFIVRLADVVSVLVAVNRTDAQHGRCDLIDFGRIGDPGNIRDRLDYRQCGNWNGFSLNTPLTNSHRCCTIPDRCGTMWPTEPGTPPHGIPIQCRSSEPGRPSGVARKFAVGIPHRNWHYGDRFPHHYRQCNGTVRDRCLSLLWWSKCCHCSKRRQEISSKTRI